MTDQDRAALTGLKGHPGWEVLIKIMEAECERKKLDMVDVDPADHNAVLAAHAVARSAYEFYTRVVKAVDHQIAEFKAKTQPVSQEEAELQSILTPFPVGLPDEGDQCQPKQ